jgi:two-component system, LytTR family, response regulator
MTLRAVIVEDEPLAIDRLRSCLAYEETIEVAGEAQDGWRAVTLIDRTMPDVVFLDVRLPGCSGFDVLKRLTRTPAIIFTTAHDEYAVHAFEWGAFDYLLKPFDQKRVHLAVQRLVERHRLIPTEDLLEDRLRSTQETSKLSRFFVRHQGTVLPVDTEEIISITAEDDYSAVHLNGRTHLVYLPLREFAQRLDPSHFLRVHRSAIVNLKKVDRMELRDRRMLIYLDDGSTVMASRAGVQALRALHL